MAELAKEKKARKSSVKAGSTSLTKVKVRLREKKAKAEVDTEPLHLSSEIIKQPESSSTTPYIGNLVSEEHTEQIVHKLQHDPKSAGEVEIQPDSPQRCEQGHDHKPETSTFEASPLSISAAEQEDAPKSSQTSVSNPDVQSLFKPYMTASAVLISIQEQREGGSNNKERDKTEDTLTLNQNVEFLDEKDAKFIADNQVLDDKSRKAKPEKEDDLLPEKSVPKITPENEEYFQKESFVLNNPQEEQSPVERKQEECSILGENKLDETCVTTVNTGTANDEGQASGVVVEADEQASCDPLKDVQTKSEKAAAAEEPQETEQPNASCIDQDSNLVEAKEANEEKVLSDSLSIENTEIGPKDEKNLQDQISIQQGESKLSISEKQENSKTESDKNSTLAENVDEQPIQQKSVVQKQVEDANIVQEQQEAAENLKNTLILDSVKESEPDGPEEESAKLQDEENSVPHVQAVCQDFIKENGEILQENVEENVIDRLQKEKELKIEENFVEQETPQKSSKEPQSLPDLQEPEKEPDQDRGLKEEPLTRKGIEKSPPSTLHRIPSPSLLTALPTQFSYKITPDNPQFYSTLQPSLVLKKQEFVKPTLPSHNLPAPSSSSIPRPSAPKPKRFAIGSKIKGVKDGELDETPIRLTQQQLCELMKESEIQEFLKIPEFKTQFGPCPLTNVRRSRYQQQQQHLQMSSSKPKEAVNINSGQTSTLTHLCEDKVPLPFPWKTIADDLGFECLDTNEDEAIAYYNMVLWDDLLPPRPTVSPSPKTSDPPFSIQDKEKRHHHHHHVHSHGRRHHHHDHDHDYGHNHNYNQSSNYQYQEDNSQPATKVMSDFFEESETFKTNNSSLVDPYRCESGPSLIDSKHNSGTCHCHHHHPRNHHKNCPHAPWAMDHLGQQHDDLTGIKFNPRLYHYHNHNHARHNSCTNPNTKITNTNTSLANSLPLFRGKRDRNSTRNNGGVKNGGINRRGIMNGKYENNSSDPLTPNSASTITSPWSKTKRMWNRARTAVRFAFRKSKEGNVVESGGNNTKQENSNTNFNSQGQDATSPTMPTHPVFDSGRTPTAIGEFDGNLDFDSAEATAANMLKDFDYSALIRKHGQEGQQQASDVDDTIEQLMRSMDLIEEVEQEMPMQSIINPNITNWSQSIPPNSNLLLGPPQEKEYASNNIIENEGGFMAAETRDSNKIKDKT